MTVGQEEMEENRSDGKIKRKARRAPRKKTAFKPYTTLTWEERRALSLRDAVKTGNKPPPVASPSPAVPMDSDKGVKKRRRRRGNGVRQQPPPAPRASTQNIIIDRVASPTGFDDGGCVGLHSTGFNDGKGEFDDLFEAAFAEENQPAAQEDLEAMSRKELLAALRSRDVEISRLRIELRLQPR